MQECQERLIRMARQGDSAAITELYEATYSGVYHTVKSMIRDEDTVLDIVQDSYIKGFQSLHTLDNPQAFPAWMKRIAVNKTKDHLKRKSPLLFSEMVREEEDELPFRDERLDHLPEEVLDRQETARLIREILDTLSQDQRMVIGMYYYEDMTVQQIAAVLDCSENTVKSRLRYGRKHIERKVKELEQQGTKLYSLAPIPFLLWLFRMDAQIPVTPSSLVLQKIQAGLITPASAPKAANFGPANGAAPQAAPSSGAAVAAGAAKTAAKPLAVKVLAGILAVAVVGGGAAAVLSGRGSEKTPAEEPPAITEEVIPQEQPSQPEVPQEETIPETTPEPPAQAAPASFDGILADIQNFCTIPLVEYEADPSYYDQQYSRLGTGIPWLLQSGRQAGAYTMCVWSALLDVNGDGRDELCIGLGVSPSSITPIAIYDSTMAVTEGDALYPILDSYGGFLPAEWTYCCG